MFQRGWYSCAHPQEKEKVDTHKNSIKQNKQTKLQVKNRYCMFRSYFDIYIKPDYSTNIHQEHTQALSLILVNRSL